MRARRVAVIADVHGNAVALAAVLAEIERERPDAIVHCGDLTWGPQPDATADLLEGGGVLYVRGNADRKVIELTNDLRDPSAVATPRERWMVEHHDASLRAFWPRLRPRSSSRSTASGTCSSATARRGVTRNW